MLCLLLIMSSCCFKMCSWILCHSFIQEIKFDQEIKSSMASIQWLASKSLVEVTMCDFQDKRHCIWGEKSQWLAPYPLSSITPSRGSHLLCHGTLKQHYGEGDMVRNWGLQSITSKDIRPPANKQVSELSWTLILQTQLSL